MVYPFKKYNYDVLIDGKGAGCFSEISAQDVSVGPVEYREGSCPHIAAGKQSGLQKYGNVILKWGNAVSDELILWMREAESGTVNRKTVIIRLLDDVGRDIAEWTIQNAWPTKYTAPDFNAADGVTAIESLELAHEGLTRNK